MRADKIWETRVVVDVGEAGRDYKPEELIFFDRLLGCRDGGMCMMILFTRDAGRVTLRCVDGALCEGDCEGLALMGVMSIVLWF